MSRDKLPVKIRWQLEVGGKEHVKRILLVLTDERAWSLWPEGEESAIEAVTVRGALPQMVGHDAVWVGVVGPGKK